MVHDIERALLDQGVDRYFALASEPDDGPDDEPDDGPDDGPGDGPDDQPDDGPGQERGHVSAEFVAFIRDHLDAVRDWLRLRTSHTGQDALRDSTARFVERCTAAIHEANQFIVFEPDSQAALERLYGRFLADLSAALEGDRNPPDELASRVEAALAGHQARMNELLDALWCANVGHSFGRGKALCSDYSAELQCQVLGIEVNTLVQPVLDLGCGRHALLVRYLRERGVQAVGLDRGAAPGEGVVTGDFFDYPLGQAQWGTIVSHMAFSNHFLHHHLRADGHPERYARLYMSILAALVPGGSFVYAPGLPFFERLLPGQRYAVHKRPVTRLAGGNADRALADTFGDSVFYACQVTRQLTL